MASNEPIHITIDEDALKSQLTGALNETMSEFGGRLRTVAAVLDPVGEQNQRDWVEKRIDDEVSGGKKAVTALRRIRSLHVKQSWSGIQPKDENCSVCLTAFPCETRRHVDEAL